MQQNPPPAPQVLGFREGASFIEKLDLGNTIRAQATDYVRHLHVKNL